MVQCSGSACRGTHCDAVARFKGAMRAGERVLKALAGGVAAGERSDGAVDDGHRGRHAGARGRTRATPCSGSSSRRTIARGSGEWSSDAIADVQRNSRAGRGVVRGGALSLSGAARAVLARICHGGRMPLPRDAPAAEDVPRYWRRPELADVRRGRAGEVILPEKVGREVAKIYTSFAWNRAGKTRRQKRRRYLDDLDRMMRFARDLADALGDSAAMIYPIWERDH